MGKLNILNSSSTGGGGGGGGGLLESGGTFPSTAGVNLGTTRGTTVTADSTAHTKGAYVELIASTSTDAQGIILNLTNAQTANTPYMFDIALGAAASEVVLISNISVIPDVDKDTVCTVFLPCAIPAGSRISARSQSGTSSAVIDCSLQLLEGSTATSVTDTLNANETTSTADFQFSNLGSSHNKGPYKEIISSTLETYTSVVIGFTNQNTIGLDADYLVDIAIGAAASETIILKDLSFSVETTTDFETHFLGPIPIDLPAGTRLSFRIQSDQVSSSVGIAVQIFGIR